uniref:Uncharacterized protein n=1 Tax=Ixodes ricinus TaxID=34613 RepID=A0A6B0UL48_IXORI
MFRSPSLRWSPLCSTCKALPCYWLAPGLTRGLGSPRRCFRLYSARFGSGSEGRTTLARRHRKDMSSRSYFCSIARRAEITYSITGARHTHCLGAESVFIFVLDKFWKWPRKPRC